MLGASWVFSGAATKVREDVLVARKERPPLATGTWLPLPGAVYE